MTPSSLTANNRINIGAIHADYNVGRSAQGQTEARLMSAAENLAESLGRRADAALAVSDAGVYFIRRLHLAARVNATWDAERISGAWAEAIVTALAQEMAAGDASNVVRFESRAAYLARFVTDTAGGAAGEKWYYREFAGVALLPKAAAIRTALTRDAAQGIAALALLDDSAWLAVARALTPTEARRTLEELPAGEADAEPAAAFEALTDTAAFALSPAENAGNFLAALRLFVRADRQRTGGRGGRTLARAALAVTELRRLYTVLTPPDADALRLILERADTTELMRRFGPEVTERLAALRDCPPALLERFLPPEATEARADAGATSHSVPESDGGQDSGPAATRTTWHGGAFLLLPLIEALPLEEIRTRHATPPFPFPASLLRFVLLCYCLGEGNFAGAFSDSLLRDVCGVPPEFSLADWREVKGNEGLEGWAAFRHWRREGRRWLREEADVTGETRLRAQSGGAAVICDGRRGDWMRIVRPRPGAEGVAILSGEPSPEVRFLAGRFAGDWAYLTPPPGRRPPDRMDEFFRVAAQNVLRSFAWRLPGFGYSSLPYLFANFLNVAATVVEEETRRVVRFSRSPLHLVLRMTTIPHAVYRVRGMGDNRPFVLEMGD